MVPPLVSLKESLAPGAASRVDSQDEGTCVRTKADHSGAVAHTVFEGGQVWTRVL